MCVFCSLKAKICALKKDIKYFNVPSKYFDVARTRVGRDGLARKDEREGSNTKLDKTV